MKNILFASILAATICSSCSTAYKSGQTPDDLYYAKAKPVYNSDDRYERRQVSTGDREIRMAVYDRRWRDLDYSYDYDYRYNPYSYGYNYGYYYNPYYYPYPVYSGAITFINPKNTSIRTTNLGAYTNTVTSFTPAKSGGAQRTITLGRYNNNNNTQPAYNSYENRSNTVDRTYNTPSTNNNSSSNSAPAPAASGSVSRPARGN